MQQRIVSGTRHVRIARQVIIGVEQRMRAPPFCRAESQEVKERVHPDRRYIRILRKVISAIEERSRIDSPHRGNQARVAAFQQDTQRPQTRNEMQPRKQGIIMPLASACGLFVSPYRASRAERVSPTSMLPTTKWGIDHMR